MTDPTPKVMEAGRQLTLPMFAMFNVRTTASRAVAHALDFDIVAVAATSDEALRKLRLAVRDHVEFGFKHNLSAEEIQRTAPDEFWDKAYNGSFTLGEDIEIDHQRIKTMTRVVNESEASPAAA